MTDPADSTDPAVPDPADPAVPDPADPAVPDPADPAVPDPAEDPAATASDDRSWAVVDLLPVVDELLAATGASRTTIRLASATSPTELVAEARAPGVASMRTGPTPPITTAPTYLVLAEERRLIIQDDCRIEPPAPPPSLIDHYRVWAQMLAPVLVDDEMVGTVSVHLQEATRHWSTWDVAALIRAQIQVSTWMRG